MSAKEKMVEGYRDGFKGLPRRKSTAAYRHGYKNGSADRYDEPFEIADVLRRRAEMILEADSNDP